MKRFERISTHSFPNPRDFQVVRYEVDVDPDSQTISCIVLSTRSRSGEVRRLRFVEPSIEEYSPLQIPLGHFAGSVYMVDTSFRGWEDRVRIEVGSLAEDYPTFFYAKRVENDA